MPILIDAALSIDLLRGNDDAERFFADLSTKPFVSALTRAELYADMRGTVERQAIDAILAHTTIVPVSDEIAQEGGEMRNQYGPSHGVGLVDALIAATANAHDATVITLNTKHFPMVACERPY